MERNTLYYGDNLDVLRRYIDDASVDLVYLDPPFKSGQDYNVLFAEQNGSRSAAQIKAFEDTWRWDEAALRAYEETVDAGGRVSEALQAFRRFLGENEMMSYLAMMAPRLVELRRVLKLTGSLYLHCDSAASHYLKMLLDAIFGGGCFRNEIIWKRTHFHGSSKRFAPLHDIILYYSKSDLYIWTDTKTKHSAEYIERHFTQVDPSTGHRFQAISLTGAGVRRGESGKPWRGTDPTSVGRHWALPGKVLRLCGITEGTIQERLDALDAAGRIYWPKKADGTPRLKWYADELEGMALGDVWTDISPISANAAERMGYPTQKPLALLERIIEASSNEGDTVLDPFCGCGTTVVSAQMLKRRWIGIDITHLATNLIKTRLADAFGLEAQRDYDVVGEPTALSGAQELAAEDPFQFQYWVLGFVGARPADPKRGADRGIDGRRYFEGGKYQAIFSVKSGHVSVRDIRDLRGVVEREKATVGALLTLQPPTRPMIQEAMAAGMVDWHGVKYPRLQILTVEELFAGKKLQIHAIMADTTFKRAQRIPRKDRIDPIFREDGFAPLEPLPDGEE